MSEPPDKEGCLFTVLCMVVIILVIYVAIDVWADKREEYYMRDLQRRVAELEQGR